MLEAQLRRDTRQKRVILQLVEQLGCHPTAVQIYSAVRKVLPRTSLSTVYRNLGILVDQGKIKAVKGVGKEIHYDHNIEEHNHIKCTVCGRVCDVNINPVDIDTLNPEQVSNFIIIEIRMNIVGICPECAEQLEKEKLQ
ncbi:MAG: transcriptional repressor [Candidatus Aegiribacteria sp.]|nr:transcriptional repressor [Candidatus Aegiribacteria sp.]